MKMNVTYINMQIKDRYLKRGIVGRMLIYLAVLIILLCAILLPLNNNDKITISYKNESIDFKLDKEKIILEQKKIENAKL